MSSCSFYLDTWGNCPEDYLRLFFDLLSPKDLYATSLVNKHWSKTAKAIFHLMKCKSLLYFCEDFLRLQNCDDFRVPPYHFPQVPRTSLEKICELLKKSSSSLSREQLLEHSATVLNLYFQEFSKNAFGHLQSPLTGTRSKLLAYQEPPFFLLSTYGEKLKELMRKTLLKYHGIEIRGNGKKINAFFLRKLIEVMKEKRDFLPSLTLTRLQIVDSEALEIGKGILLEQISSLNLSYNQLSHECIHQLTQWMDSSRKCKFLNVKQNYTETT